MKPQYEEYFNSKDDVAFLLKKFGKYTDKWFESVFIYITENCQLKCKHCYLGERLNRRSQMPIKQIKSQLKLWKNLGAKRVCFIGGEPTLHPDYSEAVEYANRLGYEIFMDTNGIPPATAILKQFKKNDFKIIQISLDGSNPKVHDLIRGNGNFQLTINTIKELKKIGHEIWIISTLNRLNIDDSLEILKLADRYHISLVKFHICTAEGNGKANPEIIISPHEWIRFIEKIMIEGKKYKTQVLFQPTFANNELGKLFVKDGYTGCLAKQLCKVSVFPDNRIYLCSCLFDTKLNFAEIVDGKIKLNRTSSELNLITDNQIKEKCDGCKSLNLCQKGCSAENAIQGYATCEQNPGTFPICRLWKTRA